MGMQTEYFTTMESQLKKWDADIDKLNATGAKAGAEASAKYKEQLKAMRVNRDAAYKKLGEMRTATESAGKQMQAGLDATWESMRKGLETAAASFKK
jgi:hypothetical protein